MSNRILFETAPLVTLPARLCSGVGEANIMPACTVPRRGPPGKHFEWAELEYLGSVLKAIALYFNLRERLLFIRIRLTA
jgi:hypothetical protein